MKPQGAIKKPVKAGLSLPSRYRVGEAENKGNAMQIYLFTNEIKKETARNFGHGFYCAGMR